MLGAMRTIPRLLIYYILVDVDSCLNNGERHWPSAGHQLVPLRCMHAFCMLYSPDCCMAWSPYTHEASALSRDFELLMSRAHKRV